MNKLILDEELKHARLLVFANKIDLPDVMSVQEVTEKLGLHKIKDREWHIYGSNALTRDGLSEGLDWLANQITASSK